MNDTHAHFHAGTANDRVVLKATGGFAQMAFAGVFGFGIWLTAWLILMVAVTRGPTGPTSNTSPSAGPPSLARGTISLEAQCVPPRPERGAVANVPR